MLERAGLPRLEKCYNRFPDLGKHRRDFLESRNSRKVALQSGTKQADCLTRKRATRKSSSKDQTATVPHWPAQPHKEDRYAKLNRTAIVFRDVRKPEADTTTMIANLKVRVSARNRTDLFIILTACFCCNEKGHNK